MQPSEKEQIYRRWKLGEDPHALAKERGVTRERMRHMLTKMDEAVPLVDRLTALDAENKRLRESLEEMADICGACVFDTIRIRGQYVDRIEAVERARRALAQGEQL